MEGADSRGALVAPGAGVSGDARASWEGVEGLTKENNTNHWGASPILDPRPQRSLQGATQHDHRREAPRPRTAYQLDSAELVCVP